MGEIVQDTNNQREYEVLIVGAGPAGIFTGLFLEEMGFDFRIIEQGKKHRDRSVDELFDTSYGFGGAGLFSDGKVSYAPSASALWTNLNSDKLKKAYQYVRNSFAKLDVQMKDWDDDWTREKDKVEYEEEKKYESDYLSEVERNSFLNYATQRIGEKIIFEKKVDYIDEDSKIFQAHCVDGEVFKARKLVLGTGRNPLKKVCGTNYEKKIFYGEMGVRIEVANEDFVPYRNKQIDYKIIRRISEDTQVRTFCCCRDGEIVRSQYAQSITYNGQKKSTNTGKSNVGIMLRTQSACSRYAEEMASCLKGNKSIEVPLNEYLRKGVCIVGKETDSQLKALIESLVKKGAEGSVFGPEVEKFGYYPKLNASLQDEREIYYVGDATGMFRGLMAAFVSGVYCGISIADGKRIQLKPYMDSLKIKQSDTDAMKLIFTAQSKTHFYCRDVVCQYVLNEGCLPINPFRVFDYFLGDRVDRDIIRRGNNQLIKKCEELWVFGQIADGVLFEIASAIYQGKKIRFFSIGTRVDEIKEIDINDISFEPEVHARQVTKEKLISFIKESGKEPQNVQLSLFDDDIL